MNAPPTANKKWELTRETFNRLLESLDSDRDMAANRYEIIRRKLIMFFEKRGCLTAEELADDVINRVAKKLNENLTIDVANSDRYFFGVAKYVLKEYLDEPQTEEQSLNNEPGFDPREEEELVDEKEQEVLRLDCQKQCIEELDVETREIVIQYYSEEPGVKMKKKREALAARLGMTPNALRIKAYRIRQKLDECVTACIRQLSGK